MEWSRVEKIREEKRLGMEKRREKREEKKLKRRKEKRIKEE